MTAEQTFHVSVIDPITPAIEKVRTVLFSPFDINKWFVIGFCAWLVNLAQAGGQGFNFILRFARIFTRGYERFPMGSIHDFIADNLPLVIGFGAALLVIAFAASVVFLWLSSRGQFMFLDCVAKNKAAVKEPWHKFRMQGNSLFLFRLVVGIIGFVCFIFCVAVAVLAVIAIKIYGMKLLIAIVPLFAVLFVVFILLVMAFGILLKFTLDFVVPIMLLRNCSCVEGWRQFLPLLSNNKGRLLLYLLFQIVIGMAIGVIVLAAVCLTCCIACCILIIPYVGTVLLLPLLIFQRAYSLMYLRQFGTAFDVFAPQEDISAADNSVAL